MVVDRTPFHCSSEDKVASIGGSSCPLGSSTVKRILKDDSGSDHIFLLKNFRHFPDSPANILSLSQLKLHFKDSDDDTYIKSCNYSSRLVWDKHYFTCTITDNAGYMPHLIINAGTSIFATFLDQFSAFCNNVFHHAFLSETETAKL